MIFFFILLAMAVLPAVLLMAIAFSKPHVSGDTAAFLVGLVWVIGALCCWVGANQYIRRLQIAAEFPPIHVEAGIK